MREKSCRGAAEIVEFSFVFPLVMLTVLVLFYFIFVVFLKVHIYNLAFKAADEIGDLGGAESAYGFFDGGGIHDKELEKVKKDFHKRLEGCRILPGVKFTDSVIVESKKGFFKAVVTVETKISDKFCFKIVVEKDIHNPAEKMRAVEILKTAGCDFEGLKDIYDAIF